MHLNNVMLIRLNCTKQIAEAVLSNKSDVKCKHKLPTTASTDDSPSPKFITVLKVISVNTREKLVVFKRIHWFCSVRWSTRENYLDTGTSALGEDGWRLDFISESVFESNAIIHP